MFHGSITIFCILFIVNGSPACQNGWHYSGGRCYFFSRLATDFIGALTFCKFYGGQLMEINSYSKYLTIQRITRHRGFPNFWLGLTDLFTEGVWIKATSMKEQVYTRWGTGEPDNYRGGQHCAIAFAFGKYWGDGPCDAIWNFICEKKVS